VGLADAGGVASYAMPATLSSVILIIVFIVILRQISALPRRKDGDLTRQKKDSHVAWH
jgi:hypothetical protein